MSESASVVAEQFDDLEQQRDVARFGMWVFLVTEVLFFGGAITSYWVYRLLYPHAWLIGSSKLMIYWIGTVNTALLLISSFTMALSVHEAKEGRRWRLVLFLITTMILGLAFLGLKFYEYHLHFADGLVPGPKFSYIGPERSHVELFFSFYYLMTGMHALHMTIGILLLLVMILFALSGKITSRWHSPIVIVGLYWHFVDIVWIFLYPFFYLVGSKGGS
ncbi:MAG: cytochrome c oxidase subunit 3 [Thermoanaerobaculia bacterium]